MQCKQSGCRAYAMQSGYCWFHDPALERERKEASVKGGKHKHYAYAMDTQKANLDSITGIKELLQDTIINVINNKSYITKARIIGYLVTILKEVILDSELEQRVFRLEEQLLSNEKNERG